METDTKVKEAPEFFFPFVPKSDTVKFQGGLHNPVERAGNMKVYYAEGK